jgi:CheY-like chemotaxis protein
LGQVLMNLVINARDAVGNGGALTLRTGRQVMDEAFVESHRLGALGEYGVISVMDTGMGMDQQTMQRIFEPFFTTKEVGKGTGLGLSMVYGIVEQHSGYIEVQSEPGVGTTFLIYLPLIVPQRQQAVAVARGVVSVGTETVLLAEDDTQVREMTQGVLEEFGYRVIAVRDGGEAVQAFREQGEHIDLVILDVIMPVMNGKEAYDEIRRIMPEIKVLFTSGYTADVISQKGINGENLCFLAKPLAPEVLLGMLREMLDKC